MTDHQPDHAANAAGAPPPRPAYAEPAIDGYDLRLLLCRRPDLAGPTRRAPNPSAAIHYPKPGPSAPGPTLKTTSLPARKGPPQPPGGSNPSLGRRNGLAPQKPIVL